MANFFDYIGYCFSLIPTWLSAVFVALLVFVITYAVMLFFAGKEDEPVMKPQKMRNNNTSTEFDDLLATVLASKDKGHNINMIQPAIKVHKTVSPSVVVAISAAVSQVCPEGKVCSIETA